jgi:hypothetical protein
MALVTGCSSNGQAKESTKAVGSLQETYERLGKGKVEVDRTVAAMDQLVKGTDLKSSFKSFSDSVAALKSAGEAVTKQSAEMRDKRDEYLATWEKEVEGIKNQDIKESAEQRRVRIKASYDSIASAAGDVRAAYPPYLQDLQDIQKALSLDLTPAGVAGVTPVINKARAEGQALSRKIEALNAQIDTLRGKMSPKG